MEKEEVSRTLGQIPGIRRVSGVSAPEARLGLPAQVRARPFSVGNSSRPELKYTGDKGLRIAKCPQGPSKLKVSSCRAGLMRYCAQGVGEGDGGRRTDTLQE